jgi:hypothetical protein
MKGNGKHNGWQSVQHVEVSVKRLITQKYSVYKTTTCELGPSAIIPVSMIINKPLGTNAIRAASRIINNPLQPHTIWFCPQLSVNCCNQMQ